MRIAILISFFLLAGIGLGFLAGRQFGGAAPSRSDFSGMESRTLAPQEPAAAPPARAIVREWEHSSTSEPAVAADSGSGPPVAVSYEEPAPVRGTGVITGRVRLEGGQPLPGVTLIAEPNRASTRSTSRKYGGPPREEGLEEKINELVERHRWESARRTRTTTGADGTFRFDGLADGRWTVSGYREGFELHTAEGSDRTDIAPGAHVELDAWEIVAVPVNVVLPGGSQADRARVSWQNEGSRRRSYSYDWSPSDATVQFRIGVHTVSATAGDDNAMRSEEVQLDLRSGAEPAELTLLLEARAGIRGRIVLPEGIKPDNTAIWALRYDGRVPDDETLRNDGQHTWAHESNGYRFAYSDLEAGTYLIGAGLSYQSVAATVSVTVLDQVVEQDIEIPPFAPDEQLALWVYAPDGSLVTNVGVGLEVRSGNGSHSTGTNPLKRADGAFLVLEGQWPEEAKEKGATRFIEVRSEEYGERRLEYVKGTPMLEVRFAEPASLEVLVDGHAAVDDGKKVQLALVREERKGANEVHRNQVASTDRVGDDGLAMLGPVVPGEYILTLSIHSSRRHYGPALAEVPVRLDAGANSARIAVPRLHSLTLVCGPEKKGMRVQLQGADGRYVGGVEVDDAGEALFEELTAGDYKVMTYGRGPSEFMELTLRGDAVVEFQASIVNALRVSVTDPQGALAKAGLRDGDLIVAAEGQEFENMQQMQLAFVAIMAKEKATVTVLRGSRRVDVEISPMAFQGGDQGGDVAPATR